MELYVIAGIIRTQILFNEYLIRDLNKNVNVSELINSPINKYLQLQIIKKIRY